MIIHRFKSEDFRPNRLVYKRNGAPNVDIPNPYVSGPEQQNKDKEKRDRISEQVYADLAPKLKGLSGVISPILERHKEYNQGDWGKINKEFQTAGISPLALQQVLYRHFNVSGLPDSQIGPMTMSLLAGFLGLAYSPVIKEKSETEDRSNLPTADTEGSKAGEEKKEPSPEKTDMRPEDGQQEVPPADKKRTEAELKQKEEEVKDARAAIVRLEGEVERLKKQYEETGNAVLQTNLKKAEEKLNRVRAALPQLAVERETARIQAERVSYGKEGVLAKKKAELEKIEREIRKLWIKLAEQKNKREVILRTIEASAGSEETQQERNNSLMIIENEIFLTERALNFNEGAAKAIKEALRSLQAAA